MGFYIKGALFLRKLVWGIHVQAMSNNHVTANATVTPHPYLYLKRGMVITRRDFIRLFIFTAQIDLS